MDTSTIEQELLAVQEERKRLGAQFSQLVEAEKNAQIAQRRLEHLKECQTVTGRMERLVKGEDRKELTREAIHDLCQHLGGVKVRDTWISLPKNGVILVNEEDGKAVYQVELTRGTLKEWTPLTDEFLSVTPTAMKGLVDLAFLHQSRLWLEQREVEAQEAERRNDPR